MRNLRRGRSECRLCPCFPKTPAYHSGVSPHHPVFPSSDDRRILRDVTLNTHPGGIHMPLQNRVRPAGEIVAADSRGNLLGNRGIIHDPRQQDAAQTTLDASGVGLLPA